MNSTIESKTRHTRWVGQLATYRRARTIAAVLTGFCAVVALVSAAGKLTNQASVVELLDHVEVHGWLRGLLPVLQIAGGLGALASLLRFPKLGLAALTGLAVYFAGAVIAHLRVGDGAADIAIPLGYVLVMSITADLRGATINTD
ncbi:MAG: DoxX family protein [Microthrixaceae bacterium]|nr:DoxX family protein [Microthrixaceae bacterium]